jgi:G3E family GTPase
MSEVNIDAALIRGRPEDTEGGVATGGGERVVELSNGCICCTLREDLLTELAALALEGRFDHVLIESSGISEPLPVAQTFLHEDARSGHSLGDIARLDNLVTVRRFPVSGQLRGGGLVAGWSVPAHPCCLVRSKFRTHVLMRSSR